MIEIYRDRRREIWIELDRELDKERKRERGREIEM